MKGDFSDIILSKGMINLKSVCDKIESVQSQL